MEFKELVKMIRENIEDYEKRLNYLKSCNYSQLTSIEQEFYEEDITLYKAVFYFEQFSYRDRIGDIISVLIKDDSRYSENSRDWYFDIQEDELLNDLAKKILNADESMFKSESLKAIFLIMKFAVSNLKKYDYDSLIYESFEETVIPEIFYLAVRNNEKLLNDLEEENAWVEFRKNKKMEWEKFL